MHALRAWEIALLAVVGLAAGFVNTAAGAGSLLSMRALMLVGLPADVANGTNRVPVLVQSLTAAAAFDGQGQLERSAVLRVAAPACAGALAGALGASYLPERLMRWILIVVLLGVGLVGLWPPRPRAAAPGASREAATPGPLALSGATAVWLFVAGAYGGFLQAGVGLVLLFALGRVAGLDLVRANALKVVVIAVFTVVALGVFVLRGQVAWAPALVMSVGSALGAKLGVAYALRWAHQLKVAVVVVDVLACAALVLRELSS